MSESTTTIRASRGRRYSLRALLIGVSLAAVLLAWLGSEYRAREQNRRLAELCAQRGGSVTFTGGPLGGGRVVELHFANATELDDEDLKQLAGLGDLRTLWLNNSQVTGPGLAVLTEFSALRELHVKPDQLTSDGLRNLKQLDRLEKLTVWGLRHDDPRRVELQFALPDCVVER